MVESPPALHDIVPEFSAAMTSDQTFRLQEYRGKNIVLYFYPKDNTPGCITEGIRFRELYPDFQQANTEIFGVSRDSLRSHEAFRTKLAMPFQLLSDPDESLCNLFNVIRSKTMY